MAAHSPVVCCILDGWGLAEAGPHNAISQARTPNFDTLFSTYPSTQLRADGEVVGLPKGQFGNSEVGHIHIGAGSLIPQSLTLLNQAFSSGDFRTQPALIACFDDLKNNGGRLHIAGLASRSGVHSHQDHMVALARFACEQGIQVCLHLFTDGRDSPPTSAPMFLSDLLPQLEGCQIASVVGRYFAMDRDQRWERTEQAWRAIALGVAPDQAVSAEDMVRQNYLRNIADEFMPPCIIGDYQGLAPQDSLILMNFRSDRARQLLNALFNPDFEGFDRAGHPPLRSGLAMTTNGGLDRWCPPLFKPSPSGSNLGKVVSAAGYTQLRAAETEKFPHVTFFLNGGREALYPGEERCLVASPKVATYDLAPEMSARLLTERVIGRLQGQMNAAGEPLLAQTGQDCAPPDLTVINFANPDMVGHTGDLGATILACEVTDSCLGDLMHAAEQHGFWLVVTADHGNAEIMWDQALNCPHTAHSLSKVPFIIFPPPQHADLKETLKLREGALIDVAPTVLSLLGLDIPDEMDGHSLILGSISKSASQSEDVR